MEQDEQALSARSVSKVYWSGWIRRRLTYALKDVSLSIRRGTIFGLLGPNGAGKTTLINIFSGLIEPDMGQVEIMGRPVGRIPRAEYGRIKERMNMCSGAPNFPWSFTVRELLNFYAMLYGMGRKERREIISGLGETFELTRNLDTLYDSLSSGTKQKVALAKAMINRPEILFLDEPTIGLDPDMAIRIRRLIVSVNGQWKNTIVLTTHYMREAEELCGHIAFLKDGQLLAAGTGADLKRRTGSKSLEEAFLALSH